MHLSSDPTYEPKTEITIWIRKVDCDNKVHILWYEVSLHKVSDKVFSTFGLGPVLRWRLNFKKMMLCYGFRRLNENKVSILK